MVDDGQLMTTRLRLALVALLALLSVWGCDRRDQPLPPLSGPGPVIIVDIDTLRADHLGVYGYHRDTSPNLDAFAAESARFAWAFAQGPSTPPSQASILTGLYPTTHGRFGNQQIVPPAADTLAEQFSAAGWPTAAFVDGGLMAAGFGLEQGFDIYDDSAGGVEAIGPRADAFIEEQLAAGNRSFFLLVHTYDVHSPYEVTPEPYRSAFLDEVETQPSEAFVAEPSARIADIFDTRFDPEPVLLDAAELEWTKALYDGGIKHVDAWFGGFLERLEGWGLADVATVVVISDHGEEFQEHDSLFHHRIYSTVGHIPMMIRAPGQSWGGTVVEQAVESIDLAPTLLELYDLPIPEMVQGQSLVPLIRGESEGDGLVVTESRFYGRRIAMVTQDRRSIHTFKTGDTELFAYRTDPHEQEDLAAIEPETADELTRESRRWWRRLRATKLEGAGAKLDELDPEVVEQLKALGYIR